VFGIGEHGNEQNYGILDIMSCTRNSVESTWRYMGTRTRLHGVSAL